MVERGAAGPSTKSNSLRYRVPFGDTDAGGVVYYPNYLVWFDRATHELFRSLGLPLKELHLKSSVALPIVSVQADYKAPLRYDDEVEIISQIEEVFDRSLKVAHRVMRGKEEVTSGSEVRAWVNVAGGAFKAQSIPEEMRKRLV